MPGVALAILACYLIGSVPFPLIVSRLVKGIDLREYGSGNMGATNAARVLGKQWFPVVFGLDFAKGAGATLLARILLPGLLPIDPVLAAAVGATAAVLGHCFPIYVGFRGGVGLAASAGALTVISPLLLAMTAVAILIFWKVFKDMYVGVAAAALLAPVLAYFVGFREPGVVAAIVVWALVVVGLHLPEVIAWWTGAPRKR